MNKEEIIILIQSFLKNCGIDSSPGLNKNNLGGVSFGDTQLYFEYREGVLACSALVYRFRKTPNPKVIAALKEEEKLTDTGGGKVEFQPENQSVFLTKIYTDLPDLEEFQSNIEKLISASNNWNSQVMDRAFTVAQA
ncbi:MAG: hypothetical protein HY819_18635 [Acidobacteria bacterium]|nr:hypothetical protein [Acidobacteriota bacterium]